MANLPSSSRLRLTVALVACFMPNLLLGVETNQNDLSSLTFEDIVLGVKNHATRMEHISVNMVASIYDAKRYEDKDHLDACKYLHDTHYAIDRSGGKLLIQVDPDTEPRIQSRFAWNGVKDIGYSTYPNTGKDPRGHIFASQGSPYLVGYYLTVVGKRFFDFEQPVSTYIDDRTWILVGFEKVGGSLVAQIESPPLVDGLGQITLWVDPLKDFATVKGRVVIPVAGRPPVIQELTDIQLVQSGETWVPKSAMMATNFNIPERMETPWQFTRFEVADFKTDVRFADEHFVIEFPPHTAVWDDIAKIGFITGLGEQYERIDVPPGNDGTNALVIESPGVTGLDGKPPVPTPLVTSQPGPSRSSRPGSPTASSSEDGGNKQVKRSSAGDAILPIAAGAVVLGVALYLLMRRRRTR